MITENIERIKKLVEIQRRGQLGEVIERFAYARRKIEGYHPRDCVHAELDAGDVGRAASRLLGVCEDEAAEIALETVMPSQERGLGAELIDQLYRDLVHPNTGGVNNTPPVKEATPTTPAPPKREATLSW